MGIATDYTVVYCSIGYNPRNTEMVAPTVLPSFPGHWETLLTLNTGDTATKKINGEVLMSR